MKTPLIKNRIILVLVIVVIAIAFSVSRSLRRTGFRPLDGVYVSRVIDGDTIKLSNGMYVRYIGIDTPEIRERKGNGWIYNPMPYSEDAKAFNQRLVGGRWVRLEFDVQKKDRYNRLLAYVYTGDKMVNMEMVRAGYAMIYTYPPNVKYTDRLLDAQRDAREHTRGLWSSLSTDVISASETSKNIGLIKMVEARVLDTYLSRRVLILDCVDNFKVVIFKDNLAYFPKEILRSPDNYFKHKTIRVYGVIKNYKGSPEIIANSPSQLEVF